MGGTTRPLRVLFVDDSPDDTELLADELRRARFDVSSDRVDDERSFRDTLAKAEHDAVLCDWIIPGFGAQRALAILRELSIDLPFIIVSGQVREAVVVEALRAGAHDFVTKQELARLVPAIERELREVELRRARKSSDAQLESAREDFRRAVDVAPDPVFIRRADLLVYVNPAFVTCVGRPNADSLRGKSILELVEPEDRGPIKKRLGGALDAPLELHVTRPDGSLRTLELSAERQVTFEGLSSYLTIARDVTERRQLESQLIAAERLASLGMLAAGIAHEINNPLFAVVANVALALESIAGLRAHGVPLEELNELEAVLNDAREASEQVRFISRDLRAFARPVEQGRLPVDVREVMASSLRLARHVTKNSARVVCDFQEVLPIVASESRLGQVFLNLLVNAAQALDETRTADAQISIGIRMHDREHVLVEIADNGPGIPPQHLHRIFTPFFTTKGSSTGTGLGLSISQRIITGFGGEIALETNRPRGACFRILLPIAKELEPNRRAPTPVNLPKRGRVLVIDDDPLVGSTIRRVLSPVHEVETTSSGRAAVERLRHGERFDLILSDIEVTEQGSVDLYHELLAFAPEQAERITFVTRGVPNTQQKKFLDQISNPRIEKPFDLNQLRALLPTEEPNKAH